MIQANLIEHVEAAVAHPGREPAGQPARLVHERRYPVAPERGQRCPHLDAPSPLGRLRREAHAVGRRAARQV